MASLNLFTDTSGDVLLRFTARDYMTTHLPILEVPNNFHHTKPSGQPSPPAFPGTLTGPEQAQVNAWKNGLVTPTLANALAWKADYETYNAANDAWNFANESARIAQYRIAFADAQIYNQPTTSMSADVLGTGSTPPPASVYPRNDP